MGAELTAVGEDSQLIISMGEVDSRLLLDR